MNDHVDRIVVTIVILPSADVADERLRYIIGSNVHVCHSQSLSAVTYTCIILSHYRQYNIKSRDALIGAKQNRTVTLFKTSRVPA
jgi:hypothetical protein